MNPLYVRTIIVCIGALFSIIAIVLRAIMNNSDRCQKRLEDFRQQVNDMLQEDEEVLAICGYNPCAAVTNKRLLITRRAGVDVVAFSQITKLKGTSYNGQRVDEPGQMQTFQIKAEKNYYLRYQDEGFPSVVNELFRRVHL